MSLFSHKRNPCSLINLFLAFVTAEHFLFRTKVFFVSKSFNKILKETTLPEVIFWVSEKIKIKTFPETIVSIQLKQRQII
jgi:hypothetical protein